MNIRFLFFSKNNFSFVQEGQGYYLKKLKRFASVSIENLNFDKFNTGDSAERAVSKLLPKSRPLILLDESGKTYNSIAFAKYLESLKENAQTAIALAVGGDNGFPQVFKKRATKVISFSKFTLNHQLIRLDLLEQVYRAFTIINKEPYHRP